MKPSLRTLKLAVTSVVLLAAAEGVLAQSDALYAGISVGHASDFDTAVKVYIGGLLAPRFGWEGQYTNFGSVTEPAPFGPRDTSAFALGASLVGYLPLQPSISGIGKIGLHYVDIDDSRSGSDTSLELGIGVGVLWQVAPRWGLRAEIENIGGDGGSLFTLGAQIKF